jgi:membrane protease YdiL (CAAX protease family)
MTTQFFTRFSELVLPQAEERTNPKLSWRPFAVMVISTTLLTLDYYNQVFEQRELDHILFLLAIPLLVILLFRESPSKYGFTIGNWRSGLVFTAGGILFCTGIMLFVGRMPEFHNYYISKVQDLPTLILNTGLDLIGWEFMFRGFLLWGLWDVCGPYAIMLQAIPFSIAHFSKPQLETLSCIFGGTAFGYIGWKTKSFIYPFLIHWFLSTITILISAG